MANIAQIIAKAQITNGGPVILYQPENEYSHANPGFKFPDPDYMQYVEDQARNAGIVVPFISNDASAQGYNAPGTGKGEVDIYVSFTVKRQVLNHYTQETQFLRFKVNRKEQIGRRPNYRGNKIHPLIRSLTLHV